MALYLNQGNEKFVEYKSARIFVDKSKLIAKCNELFGTSDKYMCLTRPRRFGKTMALSMLNAYYSKGCDSKELFRGLNVFDDPSFENHLNKHNVLWIDMGRMYSKLTDPNLFVEEVKKNIMFALKDAFPNLDFSKSEPDDAIVEIGKKTGERLVFLIDEWDVLFREQEQYKKLCDEYTSFLRSLFKSSDASSFIDLVYMTGILPIKRYDSQSALNNFAEYNMLDPRDLGEFFGFTENEVKALCLKYNRDFDEIKSWYDGYRLNGMEIYNPKSVVEAVWSGKCRDYWTSTASIEPVTRYMGYDGGELKGTILEMLSGEEVQVDVSTFENDLTEVKSQDAALTVLIHLGYLSYDEETKTCRIPNKEIAEEIGRALKKLNWTDLYNPIAESKRLLEETLKGNTDYINAAFDENHKRLATIINKNMEGTLATITRISYYYALENYFVLYEPSCVTGRADAVFIPKREGFLPIVVELKADKSPDEAITQMKEKDYASILEGYHGKVMLLGIAYDSKTLKHSSKIEYLDL